MLYISKKIVLRSILLSSLCMIGTSYCAEDMNSAIIKNYHTIKIITSNIPSRSINFITSTINACDKNKRDFSEECIGQITYRILNKQAKIRRLDIHPLHQKKGLGTELMLHTFDRVRSAGIEEILLTSKEKALDFYLRLGFYQIDPPNGLVLKFVFKKDEDLNKNLDDYYALDIVRKCLSSE